MKRVRGICKLSDCGTSHYAHGYCQKHYKAWKKYGNPYEVRYPESIRRVLGLPAHKRVLGRIEKNDNECWLYQGWKDRNGYGQLINNKRKVQAHRVVWEAQRGLIPNRLHLHHTCHVRHCVNPDHLELVDPVKHGREHSYEGHAKRWNWAA